MNEVVFLLEKSIDQLENLFHNIINEKKFILNELEEKDQKLKKYSKYKKETLVKLESIKKVLEDEIRFDLNLKEKSNSLIKNKKLNILMIDDEL